jgi:dehydrogenase/reductase SDR family member 1
MHSLHDRVAVVTGGTYGVGRGVASALAQARARVCVTGRSVQDGVGSDEHITGICCDHRLDAEVTAAFDRVARETNGIDILVNNVWGGYERMVEDGVFTWGKPFREQSLWRWDAMFNAGVRAHYHASQLAARAMVAAPVPLRRVEQNGRFCSKNQGAGQIRICTNRPVFDGRDFPTVEI